jgi:hypothetical protein
VEMSLAIIAKIHIGNDDRGVGRRRSVCLLGGQSSSSFLRLLRN